MRKKTIKVISVSLLFVFLFAAVSIFSSAQEKDYSKPGTSEKITYNAADILSVALGMELCDAEKNYLRLYGEYDIMYGAHIPASVVSISYNEDNGELAVIAKKYSYVAENGANVVFVPVSAAVEDISRSFSEFGEDEYIAEFNALEVGEEDKARVIYRAEFSVTEKALNTLLNKAYYDAISWKSILDMKEKEYNELLSEYENKRELYEDYLIALAEYESELALYNAYKIEKRLYDKKLSEYNAYLSALSDYDKKLSEYKKYELALQKYNEEYLIYRQYLEDKRDYEENLLLYEQYLERLSVVKSQIAIIDGLKNTSTSLQRSVYNAIIGNTVTEVIANKDAIANSAVGVDPRTVDMAGEATENLRVLFDAYYSLKSEADKYTYYVINYEAFKVNLINLFKSLDKMYQNSKVRLAIDEKGIKEKYEILVAQLYYVVNAISDSPIYNYDGTATYGKNYVVNTVTGATPLKLLGNVPYMNDTGNATPLVGGYPQQVIKKDEIAEVKEPVRPAQVAQPIPPESVENPGEPPIEVSDPGSAPTEVSMPANKPEPYQPPVGINDLISAYNNGELGRSPRPNIVGSRNISVDIAVEKQIVGAETYKVEFKDLDGKTLCVTYADSGTYAEYTGSIPKKAEDNAAKYEFVGWMDEDGNICNIASVKSNLVLYPMFSATPKFYTVTWNIDGELIFETLRYGTVPSFPTVPQKDDFQSFEYIFEGWDKEILPVTEDVTYTARFKSEYIYTTESGMGAQVFKNEDGFVVDCGNSVESIFDLSKILPRASGYGSITVNSARYDIYISDESVIAMSMLGASKIRVEYASLSGGGGYSLAIRLLDADGELLEQKSAEAASVKIEITAPFDVNGAHDMRFYYLENENRRYANASYSNGTVKAVCYTGITYYAVVEYAIELLPDIPVELSVPKSARVGERIFVNFATALEGIKINGIYFVDSDGKRHEINENEFLMPEGGVTIGIDYQYEKYTVVFEADGKIVYTYTAKYGDTLTLPPSPEKASDGTYSYTFIGWSPNLAPVTGDITYRAKYMQVELPPKPPTTGLQITPGVMRIIVAILIVLFYLAIVILPIFVILSVKLIRRLVRHKGRGKPHKS